MSKFRNTTGTIGPYPGRTWEQEAEIYADKIFGYWVIEQIDVGKCDNIACHKPISEKYHFCSKECKDIVDDECIAEARAEAQVS